MPDRDRHEDLLKYYEFIMGPLPGRDQFKRVLVETVTAEELEVFFLLPLTGYMPHSKLKRKAKMPPAVLEAKLNRLTSEAIIMAYTVEGETESQFEIADHRSAAEIETVIRQKGFDPVWKDWDAAFSEPVAQGAGREGG